jgi:hypothetical protein
MYQIIHHPQVTSVIVVEKRIIGYRLAPQITILPLMDVNA